MPVDLPASSTSAELAQHIVESSERLFWAANAIDKASGGRAGRRKEDSIPAAVVLHEPQAHLKTPDRCLFANVDVLVLGRDRNGWIVVIVNQQIREIDTLVAVRLTHSAETNDARIGADDSFNGFL